MGRNAEQTVEQVSIGADEYNASLADDYNNFVNEMVCPLRHPCLSRATRLTVDRQSAFIGKESGKTIRLWGTREPSNTTSVNKNITIQHWCVAFSECIDSYARVLTEF